MFEGVDSFQSNPPLTQNLIPIWKFRINLGYRIYPKYPHPLFFIYYPYRQQVHFTTCEIAGSVASDLCLHFLLKPVCPKTKSELAWKFDQLEPLRNHPGSAPVHVNSSHKFRRTVISQLPKTDSVPTEDQKM